MVVAAPFWVSELKMMMGICGLNFRISLSAVMPSMIGISTSNKTKSGFLSLTNSTASKPLTAVPAMAKLECFDRARLNMRRTTAESSTMRIEDLIISMMLV